MIASLPMYDFPEIREQTDALWAAIANQARKRHVPDVPVVLTRPESSLHDHWLDPSILLSQTCGYPVLRLLTDAQHLLGSFVFRAGDPERPGWYRAVILARADDPRCAAGLASFDRAPMAANDDGSLSGWISFGAALADAGIRPGTMTFTGAHVASAELVRDGVADLACLDAHTYALLGAHRPASVAGLCVVARGPQVAATPLFTAQAAHVEPLRGAVAAAVASLDVLTRDSLQIDGFVAGGREMHEPVRALAERALAVLIPDD